MLTRKILMAYLQEDSEDDLQQYLQNLPERISSDVEWLVLHKWKHVLFGYCETTLEEIGIEEILPGCALLLEEITTPDKRQHGIFMTDVFHYHSMVEGEIWRTEYHVPCGRIARLHSEKIGSYIFYHQQYQEERPGEGDKYGVIGLYGDFLYFYMETPETIQKPSYKGKLSTNHTPKEWGLAMEPHFIAWDNGEHWKEIELIFKYKRRRQ